ncbi:MAG: malto-oligosyltrehalose trehalohydrolase [Hyphomicrobiales bacterium]
MRPERRGTLTDPAPRPDAARPSLGAIVEPDGVRFRVWAPDARHVTLEAAPRSGASITARLAPEPDGYHAGFVPGLRAGDRYRFRVDGAGPFPDPASRLQPEGVHGPSEIVDPAAFAWTDDAWTGVPLEGLVLYELHVGAFTPEGTFAAAAARLPDLRDLGVTAVELMPVADFPGARNWGYDGGALFAPARVYGAPDDLRRFVDRAHALGLAVHVDVVYNHFGPDGAYAPAFSSRFFSERHASPWGRGINLDGADAAAVRGFFIENALHWIRDYHADGLRLDATHAMVDESGRHFLAELAAAIAASPDARRRRALVIAEDARNWDRIVRRAEEDGFGLDAVWSDDFHHQARRLLAGDDEAWFRDFSGSAADLAGTIARGWWFTGQHASYFRGARGSDPAGIPRRRFVFFLQNHDQIGNRARGERLHHAIDPAAFRAATTLLLTAPETPLLFMGQEWGAATPFRFFTDHAEPLGSRVSEGRRREFAAFREFADPEARAAIPDPQDPETFAASRLRWEERDREPHASLLRLTRRLLALRRHEALLRDAPDAAFDASAPDDGTVVLRRERNGGAMLVVARLRGSGAVSIARPAAGLDGRAPEVLFTTEDAGVASDSLPVRVEGTGDRVRVAFVRPGAAIVRLA